MSSSAKNDFSQTPYPRRGYVPVGNAPRVNPGNMGSAVQKPVAQTTQAQSPAPSQAPQDKS